MTTHIADLALFHEKTADIKGPFTDNRYYHGELFESYKTEYREELAESDLDYYEGFYLLFKDGSSLVYRLECGRLYVYPPEDKLDPIVQSPKLET